MNHEFDQNPDSSSEEMPDLEAEISELLERGVSRLRLSDIRSLVAFRIATLAEEPGPRANTLKNTLASAIFGLSTATQSIPAMDTELLRDHDQLLDFYTQMLVDYLISSSE